MRDTTYGADDIDVLKGLEGVRRRPGMYIGDTEDGSGLHHMIYEVLDNAIDEAAAGHGKEIDVTLAPGMTVIIEDRGRGIPVGMNTKSGLNALEAAMGVLHAGGKFNGGAYKGGSGGLHGVGLSVVNALSTSIEAWVRRDGGVHSARFERGVLVSPTTRVRDMAPDESSGTIIKFSADPIIFKEVVDFDIATLEARFKELAHLNPGVRINLHDHRDDEVRSLTFFEEEGIRSMAAGMAAPITGMNGAPWIIEGEFPRAGTFPDGTPIPPSHVRVALMWTNGPGQIRAYTNSIGQPDGGTHVTGLTASVAATVRKWAESFADIRTKAEMTTDDYRDGLVAVVDLRFAEPTFSSQTKVKLTSGEARGGVSSVVSAALYDLLERDPASAREIVRHAVRCAEGREAADRAKDESRGLKTRRKLAKVSDKFVDATGNKGRELFIVEGDSAGGSAKQARNRVTQAILAIRGKTINIERADADSIDANVELATLKRVIGGRDGDIFDPQKSRYDRVIIMTDADIDGAHIATLLLTYFYRLTPGLIESGRVYISQPPLYRVVARNGNARYLLDESDRRDWLDAMVIEKITMGGRRLSPADIQRIRAWARAPGVAGSPDPIEPLIHLWEVAGRDNPAAKALKPLAWLQKTAAPGVTWSVEPNGDVWDFVRRERGVATRHPLPKARMAAISRAAAEIPPVETSSGEKDILSDLWLAGHRPDTWLADAHAEVSKGYQISRFKGLGEMNPDQLKETAMDPATRGLLRVVLDDPAEADSLTSTLMGKSVAPRFAYIMQNAKM